MRMNHDLALFALAAGFPIFTDDIDADAGHGFSHRAGFRFDPRGVSDRHDRLRLPEALMHNSLLINCGKIYNPTEIRYGWGDFKPGNLKSVEGLPFAPFNLKIQ